MMLKTEYFNMSICKQPTCLCNKYNHLNLNILTVFENKNHVENILYFQQNQAGLKAIKF
jgi:hypothetical protein